MSIEQLDSLEDWLNLTQRELEILKLIYRLDLDERPTTPEEITREFKKVFRVEIQKPNLFHLLKKLRQQGIIQKLGYGRYSLDFIQIEKKLGETEEKFKKNQEEFEKIRVDLVSNFKRLAWNLTPPQVQYLKYEQFYKKMGDIAVDSEIFCIVGSFPQIAYSRQISNGLQRKDFIEPAYKHYIGKQKSQLKYLTDLDIDYLFNQCFRVLEDPKKAYRETENTLDRLETIIEKTPNLDIRYLDDPHGLDVAISIKEEPEQFILFIRDEHQDIMAGINIKSKDTAKNAHQMFNKNYEYATPLNKKQGKKQIQKTRQQLKQKYGILEE